MPSAPISTSKPSTSVSFRTSLVPVRVTVPETLTVRPSGSAPRTVTRLA